MVPKIFTPNNYFADCTTDHHRVSIIEQNVIKMRKYLTFLTRQKLGYDYIIL